MIENNAISGAGSLLSEIQGQIAEAGPATAFTLVLQKQALEDRIRFKQWLGQNSIANQEIEKANVKAAAGVRLTRRAQGFISSF